MALPWRKRAIRAVALLVPVAIGLIGAWTGAAIWGRATVTMGPFQVRLTASPGRGVTDIVLPPLGHLTANTHVAPLRFSATLEDTNIPQLTDLLGRYRLETVVDRVEAAAKRDIPLFALRLLLAGTLGGLGLAVLVFRTAWRRLLAAMVSALLVTAGTEALAWQTFRPQAFLSPTFHGSIAIAPRIIGPAQTALDRIDLFRGELERVVAGAARVYTSLGSQGLTPAGDIGVLHISDVHLSPLGMSFAREVANAFDVDFVLDTGDLTSFGTPIEELILSSIPLFGRPYVYVRGNHDSMALQRRVAEIPNARVLDGTTIQVRGLTIYGLGDPVFSPNKLAALNDARFAAVVRAAGDVVRQDVSRLPGPPAIVAVHDERMAEAVAGRVPLVVSGHFHVASVRVESGTLFLRVGSTGGAGANVFTQEGGVPLSAEILHFRPGNPATLVAYDVIEQSPESGSITVRRHLVEQAFGALVPSPSPILTPSTGRPALTPPSSSPATAGGTAPTG